HFHPLCCVYQCFWALVSASLCKKGRAMHISRVESVLNDAMQIDESAGIYRCRRDIFTDPDLFVIEMKYLFEGGWVYLAHESQIADANDYFTTHIGRQTIVIPHAKDDERDAFTNACAQRGATSCRRRKGNRGTFTCACDGWTFGNDRPLVKVKDDRTTQYLVQFNTDASHDLTRLP